MLLYELSLIPALMVNGLFKSSAASLSPQDTSDTTQSTLPLISPNYDSLSIHRFLKDHSITFMAILSLVAGSRLSGRDPRHQGGTRRDVVFEEAVAAVLERLAAHSSAVNSWFERQRHSQRQQS